MSEPTKSRSRLDQIGLVFVLIWGLGLYLLFFKGPAANSNQQMFRIAIVATGAVGTLVVMALKLRGRNKTGA
jgi:hypothetical protein